MMIMIAPPVIMMIMMMGMITMRVLSPCVAV
jgi:hypothetical protein